MTGAAFLADVVHRCLVLVAGAAEATRWRQLRHDRACVARITPLVRNVRLVLDPRRLDPVTRRTIPVGRMVITMTALA